MAVPRRGRGPAGAERTSRTATVFVAGPTATAAPTVDLATGIVPVVAGGCAHVAPFCRAVGSAEGAWATDGVEATARDDPSAYDAPGTWRGVSGRASITLDLARTERIGSVTSTWLHDPRVGIAVPDVEVEVSHDAVRWRSLGSAARPARQQRAAPSPQSPDLVGAGSTPVFSSALTVSGISTAARFVRVSATASAWAFVGEVDVHPPVDVARDRPVSIASSGPIDVSSFPDSMPSALTDGARDVAPPRWWRPEWTGVWAPPGGSFSWTVGLATPVVVGRFAARFAVDAGAFVAAPQEVSVSTSVDGTTFAPGCTATAPAGAAGSGAVVVLACSLPAATALHVRATVTPTPGWWTFADEIVIEPMGEVGRGSALHAASPVGAPATGIDGLGEGAYGDVVP